MPSTSHATKGVGAGSGVRVYDYKEAQGRPTGVLPQYGNEYLLLGGVNVLVGARGRNADVVVLVILTGVIIDRKARVATRNYWGVRR